VRLRYLKDIMQDRLIDRKNPRHAGKSKTRETISMFFGPAALVGWKTRRLFQFLVLYSPAGEFRAINM
jgi:hypothetical protein